MRMLRGRDACYRRRFRGRELLLFGLSRRPNIRYFRDSSNARQSSLLCSLSALSAAAPYMLRVSGALVYRMMMNTSCHISGDMGSLDYDVRCRYFQRSKDSTILFIIIDAVMH